MNTTIAQEFAQVVRNAREKCKAQGHDVSKCTIGIDPFDDGRSLRLVDDTGGYWWKLTYKGHIRTCVGFPSRATEAIANSI